MSTELTTVSRETPDNDRDERLPEVVALEVDLP
jgi:hypothetical protein